MFKKILVTVDGSDVSRRGLFEAIALAADQLATLYVLNVVDGMPASWSNYVDNQFRPTRMELLLQGLRVSGQRVLDEAQADCRSRGQPAETLLVDARGRTFAAVTLEEAHRAGAAATWRGQAFCGMSASRTPVSHHDRDRASVANPSMRFATAFLRHRSNEPHAGSLPRPIRNQE